jgi:hypothetical protein
MKTESPRRARFHQWAKELTRLGERTWFALAWYRLASGRYEITCYLS